MMDMDVDVVEATVVVVEATVAVTTKPFNMSRYKAKRNDLCENNYEVS